MKCKNCNKEIIGRADKKFCSSTCKNQYNNTKRKYLQGSLQFKKFIDTSIAIYNIIQETEYNENTKMDNNK